MFCLVEVTLYIEFTKLERKAFTRNHWPPRVVAPLQQTPTCVIGANQGHQVWTPEADTNSLTTYSFINTYNRNQNII